MEGDLTCVQSTSVNVHDSSTRALCFISIVIIILVLVSSIVLIYVFHLIDDFCNSLRHKSADLLDKEDSVQHSVEQFHYSLLKKLDTLQKKAYQFRYRDIQSGLTDRQRQDTS